MKPRFSMPHVPYWPGDAEIFRSGKQKEQPKMEIIDIRPDAAPAADKFREIDSAELADIIREIRVNETSARQTEWAYDAWQIDIAAATRAAELQDAFNERIFVARDEDGYYFAHEARS